MMEYSFELSNRFAAHQTPPKTEVLDSWGESFESWVERLVEYAVSPPIEKVIPVFVLGPSAVRKTTGVNQLTERLSSHELIRGVEEVIRKKFSYHRLSLGGSLDFLRTHKLIQSPQGAITDQEYDRTDQAMLLLGTYGQRFLPRPSFLFIDTVGLGWITLKGKALGNRGVPLAHELFSQGTAWAILTSAEWKLSDNIFTLRETVKGQSGEDTALILKDSNIIDEAGPEKIQESHQKVGDRTTRYQQIEAMGRIVYEQAVKKQDPELSPLALQFQIRFRNYAAFRDHFRRPENQQEWVDLMRDFYYPSYATRLSQGLPERIVSVYNTMLDKLIIIHFRTRKVIVHDMIKELQGRMGKSLYVPFERGLVEMMNF